MTVRVAFVCVRNAGRSQMASAFAEREVRERGLDDAVEIVTGGTDPAESVHGVVVEAMAEEGIDLSDRRPRNVTTAELDGCDYVVTMGCSTLDLADSIDTRDWALDDPDEASLDRVREIRGDIERRVTALIEEIAADTTARTGDD